MRRYGYLLPDSGHVTQSLCGGLRRIECNPGCSSAVALGTSAALAPGVRDHCKLHWVDSPCKCSITREAEAAHFADRQRAPCVSSRVSWVSFAMQQKPKLDAQQSTSAIVGGVDHEQPKIWQSRDDVQRIIGGKIESEYDSLRGCPGFCHDPLTWEQATTLVQVSTTPPPPSPLRTYLSRQARSPRSLHPSRAPLLG